MKKTIYLIALVVLISTIGIQAQEVLSKAEALELTLANNYNIRKTNNSVAIADNNKSLSNTGYYPTVTVNGGGSYKNQDSEADFVDGTSNSVNGAESRAYNASVGLNYTLFNGFARRNTLKRLKETYNLTELQARQMIEQTVTTLFVAYYEVARLTEVVLIREQALIISQKRQERANYRFNYGQNTKLQVLNAEVDVNNDEIAFRNSRQQLANAKRDLNVVLGREINTPVAVETSLAYNLGLSLEETLKQAKSNNVTLLQSQKNIELSQYDIKTSRAGWMPNVGLTSSYAWNKSISDPVNPFSPLANTQTGVNAGLNLSWNIFDGGKTATNYQNAKINMDTQAIAKEQQTAELQRNVANVWELYQNQLFTYKAQEKIIETAQQNFERTQSSFDLGQVTTIEFRQAQINLLNAKLSGNSSKFQAKNTELQLLQLAGELLKNKVY